MSTKKTFTDEERAAMRDAAEERKAGKVDGESEVLAKLAEMPEAEEARIVALVKKAVS
jgi:hypothetical protein